MARRLPIEKVSNPTVREVYDSLTLNQRELLHGSMGLLIDLKSLLPVQKTVVVYMLKDALGMTDDDG